MTIIKNQCCVKQSIINGTIQLDKEKQERDLIETKSNEIAAGLLWRHYLMHKRVSDDFQSTDYLLRRLEVILCEMK